MDKKQFAIFASGLRTYYPRENLLPNEQAMELWFKQLEDIDYKVAEVALHKWVATNKWSPSIADLRETATEITQGEIPDWGAGWHLVNRAIHLYGSYEPEKAYAMMDEITATCVKRLGWNNLCFSENQEADRANFRMIFEAEAKRKRREAQVPPKIAKLAEKFQLKSIDEALLEDKENV